MENAVSDIAINLSGVALSFGSRVIFKDLSLSMYAGEAVAITGRSGSGKTTLLSLLLGLLTPSSGSVQVLGTDLPHLPRNKRAEFRARHIGVVFQDGELLAELTAAENVALPMLLSLAGRAGAYARAESLLKDLDVDPRTPTTVLSGGERQRVGLARALINEPQIVYADEPTGSLDTTLRDQAADVLFHTAQAHGCTLVIVTHDPHIAQRAGRHLILADGRLHATNADFRAGGSSQLRRQAVIDAALESVAA